ncbi:MAG: HAD-IA family hydrolase [Gammaproteobacteria bacterium]|nr:HAD-IA family hydrolase [Gammaproteobacteria bacterium]MCY4227982.1 HAD-IA family hydrolase [Gammaproteobacteria bacterium]
MHSDLPQSGPADGVLFDLDGLLLNTEVIYTRVSREIVSRYGKTFDWSVKANMIGRPAIDSSRHLVEALNIPMTPEEYLEEREELLRKYLAECKPLPGAEKLIRHLHRHKIPIAIATSSSQELYEIKVRHHRSWIDLFDAVVTSDDPAVNHGKPSPDIFLVAASSLEIQASRTLVFEDAPSGLEAGKAAHMQVIVVPDPNMDKSRYEGAVQILGSLLDFDPPRFGLPAFVD